MRKIREVLRLVASGLSHREVSRCSGMGKTTVRDCLARARRAGMDWPQAQGLSDEDVESRLYPAAVLVPASQRPAVDWSAVHQELRHKGVTLSLLWEEYREREPRGYRYSYSHQGAYRGNCITQTNTRSEIVLSKAASAAGQIQNEWAGICHPLSDDLGLTNFRSVYAAPDLTWTRPDEAWRMEMVTFSEIQSFMVRQGTKTAAAAALDFRGFLNQRADLDAFNRAKSREQKRLWLAAHVPPEVVEAIPWDDVTLPEQ